MKKVLIIDDDELMLRSLGLFLHSEGFTILSTADGPQGLAIFRAERPDAVILDIGLPTMDGTEVLRQILQHDPAARVIVATGYSSSLLESHARSLGAYAFVTKPFDADALVRTIRNATA